MPGTQEGDDRNRTCHLGRTCSKNNPNSPESPAHIVYTYDTASYARVYQAVMTADKRRRGRSVETWMGFPRPSMKNLLRGPEAFQTLLLPDKYSMPYSFFFCKFCESFFGSFAVLLFTFFVAIFFAVRSYLQYAKSS